MSSPEDFDGFLTVFNEIPEKWEDAREFLTEHLRESANLLNSRDYGYYVEDEVIAGQVFETPSGELGDVTRKLIDLGGLPNFNTGTGGVNPKNVAHGLTFSANTVITRFYGAASDPGASSLTKGIPLPFVDGNGSTDIGLEIDSTNIIIRGDGTTDYSAYTRAYAVVEYIDEA